MVPSQNSGSMSRPLAMVTPNDIVLWLSRVPILVQLKYIHQSLSSSVPPSFPLHPLGLERTCHSSYRHFRHSAHLCRKGGRALNQHSLEEQAVTCTIGPGGVLKLGQAFVVLNPL